MLTFRDDEVKDQITEELGTRPSFALEAFPDPEQDVRQSIIRLRANPFITKKDQIRGFVFDVKTGTATRGNRVKAELESGSQIGTAAIPTERGVLLAPRRRGRASFGLLLWPGRAPVTRPEYG